MRLLSWLSLAYAAVLVTALAVILIVILLRLLQVRRALRPVAAALTEVSERTLPLQDALADLLRTVTATQREMNLAAEAVVRAGEPLGISPPQSPTAQAGATGRWAGGPE